MTLEKTLETIGLTQNEITVYLYVLAQGIKTGNEIYTENNLDKSSAYKAIAQLLSRGLLISSGDQRNQRFQAAPVEKALELFDKKRSEIEQSKNDFKNIVTSLDKFVNDRYHDENIRIFTGFEGSDALHHEMLKGKVSVIRSIETLETSALQKGGKPQLDKQMNWFIPERVSKKIHMRLLYDINTVPIEYQVTDPANLKEARRFSGSLSLDSILLTFGDRCAFQTMKNGDFWAIMIKDPPIVSLLNSIYDALWNLSEVQ